MNYDNIENVTTNYMSGRTEHKIKLEKVIDNLLKDQPKYLTEYYYSISAKCEIRTCKEYLSKIKKFLKFLNEDTSKIEVEKITDTDIAKFFKSIERKENKYGDIDDTSFAYRRQYYAILNKFFAFLFNKGYIKTNPMDFIECSKKKDKVERHFMDKDDVETILKGVETGVGWNAMVLRQKDWKTRDKAIILMLITTGVRATALTEINVNDLDFQTNEIVVTDKEHEVHTFTMSHELRAALLEWLKDREKLLGGKDIPALFISWKRERLGYQSIRKLTMKYSWFTLGESYSPHKFRASFANMIYGKTGDVYLTANALRHKNVETTMRYLCNDEKKVNKKTVDIMNSIFK